MRRTRAQRTSFRSSVALLTVALTAGFLGGATGAEAAGDNSFASPVRAHASLGAAKLANKVSNPMRTAHGRVTAFVELAHPAGIDTFNQRRAGGASVASAQGAARQTKSAVGDLIDTVSGRLHALDSVSHVLFRTSNALAGFAVVGDATQIRRLAGRDDVRSIETITPKKQANADAVQLTKTLNAWQQTGKYGDGVKVGIIDNGIDYTHADFGGPGTKAAYNSVDRTQTAPPDLFPSTKVAGGTDLAGDDYDAATPGRDTPHPDSNPLPCSDHGTHVAGTTAGYGENADGTTYTGDYNTLTPAKLAAMKIGPGTAPEATLYAYKVFGCSGSTNLTSKALDTALDPNGDGNYSDKMNVVNLSLGGDFGAPDDPDSAFVHKLSQNGVLSVIAQGNAGDVYDAGGSPGDATDALTVASVKDRGVLLDGLKVNAPSDVAGVSAGQYSIAYTKTTAVTANVVKLSQASNTDACSPLNDADKAAVKNKIAWVTWDDNDTTRRCGSAVRTNNLSNAGAVGSIFTSTLDLFAAGISGNAAIPVFQLTGPETKKLEPAVDAGTLNVTLDPFQMKASVNTAHPEIEDTPSDFTSRGVRGPVVKPDLAAPGDTIVSALAASGNDRESISGTSMATPHMAGISALLRQVNPTWTPEEIKAGLMNTADGTVYSGNNHTGRIEAPQRVGSGRADALAALQNKVLAMNADDPGAVSVSFGTVEAPAALSRVKTIKLVNKGGTTATFNAGYTGITKLPGVSYGLSTRAITVPANGTATVKLTLRIDNYASLRKLIDPTMSKTQLDLARQFLADASGLVQFTPTSGSTVKLRVPVYSAPKPVSTLTTPDSLTANGQGTATLGYAGRGLNQGSGDSAYRSLSSVLQLGTTSGQLPACSTVVTVKCTINNTAKGADLRYVGAMTTAPGSTTPDDALLGIGIATWGDWYNIGSNTIPVVDIDTNGDTKPDYEIQVTKLTDANAEAQDVLVAATFAVTNGIPGVNPVDVEPINGQLGDVDTNTFDTNVLVAPVLLSKIGIDPTKASAPLSYTVSTFGYYTAPGAGANDPIDSTGPASYDPLKPGYYASGTGAPALTYVAQAGSRLVVHRNAAAAAAQNATSVLVVNYQNAKGTRAKAIQVNGPAQQAVAGH